MANLVHRDDVRRMGVGLIALTVALTIAYIGTVVQAGGKLPGRDYTTVVADFDDVGTLKRQQKVTENGLRVGSVTKVQFKDGGGARVTMRLDGDQPIYSDATAKVGNESALGRKFVDLDRGTPGAGPLGARPISAAVNRSAADLNTLLEAFPGPARAGLGTLMREIGGGMTGHGQDLQITLNRGPELLGDAQTVLDAVNSHEADLPSLLRTADRLATSIHGHEAELSSVIKDAGTTFDAINTEDTEPLRETLDELPETLETAREDLHEINPALEDTAEAAKTLRPGIESLVDATPDLRGFLTESPPVARVVVKFAHDSADPVATLVPAIHDARPLVVKRLARTFQVGGPFLDRLYPYIPDAGHLVAEYRLLSGKLASDKHYFSAQMALPGIYNLSPPVADPTVDVDAYPGAGNAWGGSGD